MNKVIDTLLLLTASALVATAAPDGVIMSEEFSGDGSTNLIGTTTPDGNDWQGKLNDRIKQDGSTDGKAFTAYHPFSLASGMVYTLEAQLSPSNRADNQWLTLGFAVTARDGDDAPHQDGGTTYGQSILSGSGFRYGWAGPDTKEFSGTNGPGLHTGAVKVVLDTGNQSAYTIELFDGTGASLHAPKSIGKPAITQIFIGNSGTGGAFGSVTLSAKASKIIPANATESSGKTPVIVMLGDSTTDRGMPEVVKKQLDELIKSPEKRPTVINAGKGGDNATNALERLEKDVLKHDPDIVTVSFGLNDTGGRKPDQFEDSLKKMVKILKAADIQIVLMTSTPFNNDRHGWGKNFESDGGLDEYMDNEFCAKMRALADGREVRLCDLHTIFKKQFKQDAVMIDKLISSDGVHLTAEGNLMAAKHIAPVLHKLLEGK